MRTVVVGAGGMLGQDVAADVSLTRSQLDVTDRAAVREAVYFGMKSGFIPKEKVGDELIAGTERGGELVAQDRS